MTTMHRAPDDLVGLVAMHAPGVAVLTSGDILSRRVMMTLRIAPDAIESLTASVWYSENASQPDITAAVRDALDRLRGRASDLLGMDDLIVRERAAARREALEWVQDQILAQQPDGAELTPLRIVALLHNAIEGRG